MEQAEEEQSVVEEDRQEIEAERSELEGRLEAIAADAERLAAEREAVERRLRELQEALTRSKDEAGEAKKRLETLCARAEALDERASRLAQVAELARDGQLKRAAKLLARDEHESAEPAESINSTVSLGNMPDKTMEPVAVSQTLTSQSSGPISRIGTQSQGARPIESGVDENVSIARTLAIAFLLAAVTFFVSGLSDLGFVLLVLAISAGGWAIVASKSSV
jgi:hypothetical protein